MTPRSRSARRCREPPLRAAQELTINKDLIRRLRANFARAAKRRRPAAHATIALLVGSQCSARGFLDNFPK